MSTRRKGAIIGAIVGVMVVLAIMAIQPDLPTRTLLTLWPSSIFGFGYQGGSPWTTGLLIAVLEFGGNALIYGLVGFIIGMAIDMFRNRHLKDVKWTFRG